MLTIQSTSMHNRFEGVDGFTKILAAFLLILGILITPLNDLQNLLWIAGWFALLTLFALYLNFQIRKYLIRSAIMIFFLTIPLPFHPFAGQDQILWQWSGISLFKAGAQYFATIWLKSMSVLMITLIVIESTSYPAILKALQRMKLPSWILAVLMYMFRLFFLLEDEFSRIKQAFFSRSMKLTLKRKIYILGSLSGVYLARLMDRSERSYQAMVSRGFHGKIEIMEEPHFGGAEWLTLFGAMAYMIGFAI